MEKPFARVGSHADADIALPSGAFPPLSFYLHAVGERIYCLGLEAPAGSSPVKSGWLPRRRFTRLGGCRVMADLDTPAHLPAQSLLAAPRRRNPAPVVVVENNGPARRWATRLARHLTLIGRAPSNHIRLADATVARFHCVLFWDGQWLWAVNLLSANGTRLNGRWIDSGRVLPGESLSLGEVRVTHVPRAIGRQAALSIRRAEESAQPARDEAVPQTPPDDAAHRRADHAQRQTLLEEMQVQLGALAGERDDLRRQLAGEQKRHDAELERLQHQLAELSGQLHAGGPKTDPVADESTPVRLSRRQKRRGRAVAAQLDAAQRALAGLREEQSLWRAQRERLAAELDQLRQGLAIAGDGQSLPGGRSSPSMAPMPRLAGGVSDDDDCSLGRLVYERALAESHSRRRRFYWWLSCAAGLAAMLAAAGLAWF